MSNTFTRSHSLPTTSDDEQNSGDREEGIVRDILDELDRERTKRAELEAQLRETTEQHALDLLTGKSSAKNPTKKAHENQAPLSPSSSSPASRQEWIALQTERDGYKELLNALTADNDAITTAARAPSTSSLPLHIVRLLEIMPWHAQALEHAFANEEIFEWQHFVRGEWTSLLRLFPIRFRTLPIVKPQQKDLPKRIFGGEQPPKQGVLTDTALTKIIDVSHGYPLPNDEFATWQWVSGWRIDKRPQLQQRKIDCDQHGWSYAKDPEHFLTNAAQLCWSSPFEDDNKDQGPVTRPFRLRSWKRRRVLISYPQASQCALEYLQLLSENARLGLSLQKLNDQLVETKTKLTDAEEKLLQSQEKSALEHKELRDQLKEKDNKLKELDKHNEEATSPSKLAKSRGGLASSWGSLPSTASSDGDDVDEKEGDNDMEDGEDRRFGWGRFGRGSLIEQIKRSPAGNALLQGRNGSDHSRSASADPILSLPTLEETETPTSNSND